MLIPSVESKTGNLRTSLSRRVNANSQLDVSRDATKSKLIKKGEC